jgi:hypothetical protein
MIFTLRPNAAALSTTLYRQEPNSIRCVPRCIIARLKKQSIRKHDGRHHPTSDAKHNLHPLVHVEARSDHGHDFHVPNSQSDVESADSLRSVYVFRNFHHR